MPSQTRNLIKLRCEKCKKINYSFWKKKGVDYKLNLSKFCKSCRKHTEHKESKK